MRGAIKHIILLFVAAIVILFLAIPVLRRMEPHHDVVPPPVHDTTQAVPPAGTPSRVIDEREPAPQPIERPLQPGVWRNVITWEGTSARMTQPFQIAGHTWRITWDTQIIESLGTGAFKIMVFDQNGALKSVAANTTKTDHGSTILPGPGTFTLSIDTLQKWKVLVEERG